MVDDPPDTTSAETLAGGLANAESHRPPVELSGRGGAYRLTASLGRGGFAEVFLAEQISPVRRRVALKLLRPDMESEAILARFEAERQALALMDHPNVAKVLDAGTADDGRPYFVMEYVPGVPILEHCDRLRLGLAERLGLFQQACRAIQHAHQKGIIHRDVKPSNVLVATGDEQPLVKVIDFGVAKATGTPLTSHDPVTELGQLIGTPEYMSPEQVEMTAQDIDTRTDVYSLGVLLYELLVGALPFDSEQLRGQPYARVLDTLRKQEPLRPSSRLASLGGRAGDVAALRRNDPVALARKLAGDLDLITMKAMAKDRTQRYSSVSELAADIERHLHHEPVAAGPPSTRYRLWKFIRRNRLAVAAAGVLVFVLVAGILATSILAVREAHARARAEAESTKARAAIDYLGTMLGAADPSRAGSEIRVLDVVDAAAVDLSRGAISDPDVEATVRSALGSTYLGLGRLDEAGTHLRRALDLRRAEYGPDSLEVADSLARLGWLAMHRDDTATARKLLEDSLSISAAHLGEVHARVADLTHNLGVVLQQAGELEQAETMLRRSLAISRALPDADTASIALTMSRLGALLALRGNLDEAEVLEREALAKLQQLGPPPHVRIVEVMLNLASLLVRRGATAEAERLASEAVALCEERYGADGPDTAQILVTLATTQQAGGRLAVAESNLLRALAIYRRTYGERHSSVAVTSYYLAEVVAAQGRDGEAVDLYDRVVDLYRGAYGDGHWLVANARCRRGVCLGHLGRDQEAEREMVAAYDALQAAGMDDRAAVAAGHLAAFFENRGRQREAEAWKDHARQQTTAQSGGP